jgi:hypothetical protein
MLLTGLLLERTTVLLLYALQNCPVTHCWRLIIRGPASALFLLAGLLPELTDGLLSFALQNAAVTHR